MREGRSSALAAGWLRPEGLAAALSALQVPARWAHSRAMDDADARDIRASLAGDSDAYGRLLGRYQQEIARRMWRFTRDRGELEELVQDVFVEAYLGLRRFRGCSPFLHWLNRIATRVGYRFWKRRRQARVELPLQDWDELAEADSQPLEAREAAEKLHELLGQLPPRDRLALTLLYLEELPVAEAAERAGWSRTMMKVQAHRARKKLRALLLKSGGSER